jgi:[ribosomal protein S5]-alanine N-acetyltransferase
MQLSQFVTLAPDLCLQSERLLVRRFADHDRATGVAHERDRGIMRWIRDPQPEAESEQRLATALQPWSGKDGEWLLLTVAPRAQRDAMLGIVCCRVTTHEHETMEIGYRLATDVHRRGYCFEAVRRLVTFLFDEIRVRKLVAMCVAENEPSWRLLEKLGMRREGRLREYTHLDGAWRDELVYGLLAREWPPAVTPR